MCSANLTNWKYTQRLLPIQVLIEEMYQKGHTIYRDKCLAIEYIRDRDIPEEFLGILPSSFSDIQNTSNESIAFMDFECDIARDTIRKFNELRAGISRRRLFTQ